MPGVTTTNYEGLLERITTLRDLYALSRAEFVTILGDKNGLKLHQFLHAAYSFSSAMKTGTFNLIYFV
jgi:ERCC4-type nuclease